ncbi:JAB domain-containing protein [Mariniplasma anaerobium]|nr:JAB domain-containing protein [Mariniplasma anaerobium]
MIENHHKDYYNLVEVSIHKKKRVSPFNLNITCPKDAARFFSHMLAKKDREVLGVIGLDIKNKITYFEIAHIGTLSQNLIHPREIFKAAILTNSHAIIIAHNHPSGHVDPSLADRNATKQMTQAGELIGVTLIDHLIVTNDKYYSSKENKESYIGGGSNV